MAGEIREGDASHTCRQSHRPVYVLGRSEGSNALVQSSPIHQR
jgi:hypothetical protein